MKVNTKLYRSSTTIRGEIAIYSYNVEVVSGEALLLRCLDTASESTLFVAKNDGKGWKIIDVIEDGKNIGYVSGEYNLHAKVLSTDSYLYTCRNAARRVYLNQVATTYRSLIETSKANLLRTQKLLDEREATLAEILKDLSEIKS